MFNVHSFTNLLNIGICYSYSKKNIVPINDKIKASEVLLVDANGEKKGLVPILDALEAAKESSLDLVQVSPSDANPVVCKILDYGKHLFSKKKVFLPQNQKLKEIPRKKLNLGHQRMLATIILN